MRVLITGAAGFIGSHVTERLLDQGATVLGVDNFNTFYDPETKLGNLSTSLKNPDFTLEREDITDMSVMSRIFAEFAPDRVIHLAAWAGVRPSIEHPALYQKVNIEGTTNLLECCRQTGVKHFIFASSSSVYGDRENVPFCESDNVDHPISPYAATKKAGELLCYTYHHLFNISTHCLRFFTVYGPRQRPEMAIAKFTRLISEGRPITLFGDGTSSRDYTYIDDIVAGVLASTARCEGYRVYNLGESKTIDLKGLVAVIAKSLGITPKIEWLPMQPGDVQRTFADITRAQAELDYHPTVNIEVGIRRYVEWYRAQA